MRDAADVRVKRAIVHIVNHKAKKLVFSDLELELEGHQELTNYFSGQIKNALSDGQTGEALFATKGPTAARDACLEILKNRKSFTDASKQLATLLYQAMGTDERIAPGSLAVCVYGSSNYPDSLALIKLDPSDALVQREFDRDGQHIVTLEAPPGQVMPATAQKLQKAALVPPKIADREFDLLVLDRQTAEAAATFFARGFLNAVPVYTPEGMTERFYSAAWDVYERLVNPKAKDAKPISGRAANAIYRQIESALENETPFDIDDWTGSLPKEAQPAAKKAMQKAFRDQKQITVAPAFAQEKLLAKRRFRGDYGVLFEVESAFFKKVVTREVKITLPNGKRASELTLLVPNFHEVG